MERKASSHPHRSPECPKETGPQNDPRSGTERHQTDGQTWWENISCVWTPSLVSLNNLVSSLHVVGLGSSLRVLISLTPSLSFCHISLFSLFLPFSAPSDKDIKRGQVLKDEGNMLVKKGEHKKAMEKYSESLKHNPTEVTTYTNRWAAEGHNQNLLWTLMYQQHKNPNLSCTIYNCLPSLEERLSKDPRDYFCLMTAHTGLMWMICFQLRR